MVLFLRFWIFFLFSNTSIIPHRSVLNPEWLTCLFMDGLPTPQPRTASWEGLSQGGPAPCGVPVLAGDTVGPQASRRAPLPEDRLMLRLGIIFVVCWVLRYSSKASATLLKTIFPSFYSFRLKPERLEQDLDRHAESARMTQGRRVTLPEFAAQLGVPESESLEDLFSLFDEVGGGLGWGQLFFPGGNFGSKGETSLQGPSS